MLRNPASGPSHARGMSLVELMVAMVAGLILIGSVLGLVVSNLQNNAAVASGIRLTQDARAINEVMTRELRRARFNGQALTRIGSGSTLTTFDTLDVATAGCIKYAYDADADGVADAGEFRMFSRTVTGGIGVLRYGRFNNAAAISCTGGNIISSPDVNVACLAFLAPTASTVIASGNASACYSPTPSPAFNLAAIPSGTIYFSMRLTTNTDSETTSSRRTEGRIQIRSGDPVAAAP